MLKTRVGAKIVLVVILCLLHVSVVQSRSSVQAQICTHSWQCPDDKFCDPIGDLCSSCEVDVCKQEGDDWERSCQYFCPRFYEKVKSLTSSTLTTIIADGSVTTGTLNNTENRWTPILPIAISLMVIFMLLALAAIVLAWRQITHKSTSGPTGQSCSHKPVVQDKTPHDCNQQAAGRLLDLNNQ